MPGTLLQVVDANNVVVGDVADILQADHPNPGDAWPRRYMNGAVVSTEIPNTPGHSVSVFFKASSYDIRGNTQNLSDEIPRPVIFTDSSCTVAYIRVLDPLTPDRFLSPPTAVTANPGGACCDIKPAAKLHAAEIGPLVQIGRFYQINYWGGCFETGGEQGGPALPVTATIDISHYVPPFTIVRKQ